MPKRRKAGTLMKSNKMANAAAPASALTSLKIDSGLIAIPTTDKVVAIKISAPEDESTHLLGRDAHR
jgi:hypothetical protein